MRLKSIYSLGKALIIEAKVVKIREQLQISRSPFRVY